ncbi:uncharacterized protein J3R85_004822 [Psidium guajava]|nr:uncharacterized protein J3R85_004822 [Psidium guajava]
MSEHATAAAAAAAAMEGEKMWRILRAMVLLLVTASHHHSARAFQSDELVLEQDDDLGAIGGGIDTLPPARPRKKYPDHNVADSDSKIQFPLEHAFGDSDFSLAGTFSARLKTWSHGPQTLTKLRFSRNALTEVDRDRFQTLLQEDDFYRIRLPSNVLSPPGRDYIVSSIKARCLPRDGLDEHFVIHMDGVNILAVNYGSPGACPYPRQLKLVSNNLLSSQYHLCAGERKINVLLLTILVDYMDIEKDSHLDELETSLSFYIYQLMSLFCVFW